MHELIASQIRWSRETFGEGPRVKGNTAHVLKEILEYREEPSVEEAVDVAMLAMDGLWRQLAEANPHRTPEELASLIRLHYSAKLDKNKGRPFTPTPPDVPSEGRPGKWKPTDAVFDVLAERRRQVEGEGWTPEHDDAHADGEIDRAAACYALRADMGEVNVELQPPRYWPWAASWWKPGNPRRMMVKAAALLIAAIERLDRKAARQ